MLLLTAFIMQITGKLFVLANYALNKDYVAKVLCVNKNKPQMHCNGKCHLKKQLKAEDKKEESPANPLKELKDFQPLFGSYSTTKLSSLITSTIGKTVFNYSSHHSIEHLRSIFHPPQA